VTSSCIGMLKSSAFFSEFSRRTRLPRTSRRFFGLFLRIRDSWEFSKSFFDYSRRPSNPSLLPQTRRGDRVRLDVLLSHRTDRPQGNFLCMRWPSTILALGNPRHARTVRDGPTHNAHHGTHADSN
jgi:hypothetical protein